MKIETQDLTWKPIVVTIETREEAQELYELIYNSSKPVELWENLHNMIADFL